MKVLVKLGGTLLEQADSRQALARQLAEVARNHSLVVVHGGGKQVTKYLADRGVQSRFVNGLRVSDEAVIEAVTAVIAGAINQQLVSTLVSEGLRAVGLSGIDGPLTTAEQLNPELGFVGKPVKSDGRLLDLLAGSGYVPTVACVAADQHGQVYNVNADQMAVSCAADWQADKLLFLTDVTGVKGGDGTVLNCITIEHSHELVRSGVATGGMQAKLEAAELALDRGVGEVIIASGWESNVCQRALGGHELGTRIITAKQAV